MYRNVEYFIRQNCTKDMSEERTNKMEMWCGAEKEMRWRAKGKVEI